MHHKGKVALLAVAVIWGLAIVFQSIGMQYIGPWTFNVLRFFLGLLLLLPLIAKRRIPVAETRKMLVSSALCGSILALATGLQLYGLQYELSGKVGFITTTYYVFVPLLESLWGRKVSTHAWIGVIIASMGIFLLSGIFTDTQGYGDWVLVFSALCFAFHIMVLKRVSVNHDSILFSGTQFFFAMILSLILAGVFEQINTDAIISASPLILYSGVVACGIGFTLQTIGQKYESATTSSLLLSQEAVFSVIFGFLLLGEQLDAWELTGCLFIVLGCIQANRSSYPHILRGRRNRTP